MADEAKLLGRSTSIMVTDKELNYMRQLVSTKLNNLLPMGVPGYRVLSDPGRFTANGHKNAWLVWPQVAAAGLEHWGELYKACTLVVGAGAGNKITKAQRAAVKNTFQQALAHLDAHLAPDEIENMI